VSITEFDTFCDTVDGCVDCVDRECLDCSDADEDDLDDVIVQQDKSLLYSYLSFVEFSILSELGSPSSSNNFSKTLVAFYFAITE
jgi:hypothetical protein